jgi:hypothetical protein
MLDSQCFGVGGEIQHYMVSMKGTHVHVRHKRTVENILIPVEIVVFYSWESILTTHCLTHVSIEDIAESQM